VVSLLPVVESSFTDAIDSGGFSPSFFAKSLKNQGRGCVGMFRAKQQLWRVCAGKLKTMKPLCL
jgi:hypothetical protein